MLERIPFAGYMEIDEMNNKPVAWIRTNKQWRKEFSFVEKEGFDIPLYTHPVKEEAEQQSYKEADGCPTELAVLQRFWRKAQEK